MPAYEISLLSRIHHISQSLSEALSPTAWPRHLHNNRRAPECNPCKASRHGSIDGIFGFWIRLLASVSTIVIVSSPTATHHRNNRVRRRVTACPQNFEKEKAAHRSTHEYVRLQCHGPPSSSSPTSMRVSKLRSERISTHLAALLVHFMRNALAMLAGAHDAGSPPSLPPRLRTTPKRRERTGGASPINCAPNYPSSRSFSMRPRPTRRPK